ncbi:ABC transporter permease [Salinicoccus bachuensis]|uniref:Transport permease protein n=1 Tax=Salinicoccus bachuensis TaxID=3136731 RepID=A0ABZ3CM07_9STAP
MKKILAIINEQIEHSHLIFQLSKYHLRAEYANHYLGVFWNILQPAMQVLIYYVVFGLGLRGVRGDVGDLPFIMHLITGLFPWLFLSQGVLSASSAIQSKIGLVTKMKFPASTLLSISIVNGFVNLIFTTSIVVVLNLIFGYTSPLYTLGLIYFVVASYAFIFALGLIMSSLIILIRDAKNVLQNFIRMFFFMTPIFWSLNGANEILHVLTSLNPFGYLVMVYRNATVLGDEIIYGGMNDHLYFWLFTVLLMYVGAHVHYKFRGKLVDYL